VVKKMKLRLDSSTRNDEEEVKSAVGAEWAKKSTCGDYSSLSNYFVCHHHHHHYYYYYYDYYDYYYYYSLSSS
jgi:hypothetical protein